MKDADGSGVVEVKAYESEDGPDEDGFGREVYYDWWYMTENLAMVPGAGFIYSESVREKLIHKKKFDTLHDLVAETCKNHPELVEQGFQAEIERCLT